MKRSTGYLLLLFWEMASGGAVIAAGPPNITSVSPLPVTAGGAGFTLAVGGTGFTSGAVVNWNGSPLPTTFVSSAQLNASVASNLIVVAGPASLTVTAAGATSNSFTLPVIPTVTSVSPTSVIANGNAFQLTVNGAGFSQGSVVYWNGTAGTALSTTYVSPTVLTATAPASLITAPGTFVIMVTSQGYASEIQGPTVSVTGGLSIGSLSPSSATAGGSGFTLSVNGSGFSAGSTALWNGAPLATTFVSASLLNAAVPANLIVTAGTAKVTVISGGNTSGGLTFTINGVSLTLTSISPASVTAGGAGFTLTLIGSGFSAGATVLVNGAAVPTTFGSPTQLTAAIPASLIAMPGQASVAVISGGTTSSSLTLTVSAASAPPAPSATQVITTVAGTNWAFPPTPLTARIAPLGPVQGVAVDLNNNLYIADAANNLVEKVTPGGTLTVLAGNGFAGYSGDGGPANQAQLNGPWGVAVDSAGDVYIADYYNHVVRKVALDGTISTAARGFADPDAVALDSAGNLYVADEGTAEVWKVSPSGTNTVVAGNGSFLYSGGDNGPATQSSVGEPTGIAVDAQGNLYIADVNNSRLRMVTPAGTITTIASVNNRPWGVTIDGAGNILMVNWAPYNNVVKIAPSGATTVIAGTGTAGFAGDGAPATNAQFDFPTGIAVDASGQIYVADNMNERVRGFIPGGNIATIAGNGNFRFSGDGSAAISASVTPNYVASDGRGNLYIAEEYRVREVSGGVITTIAGSGLPGYSGDGGPAANAQFNEIVGIASDGAGNLFIADGGNCAVRKINAAGIVSTVAGKGCVGGQNPVDGGLATNADLPGLGGVAADSNGNFYFSAIKVYKVSPLGVVSTVAGTFGQGFSGDGGPATQALFNNPLGLAVDARGNLYIVDSANNRVREVSGGMIQTVAGNGTRGYSGDGGAALNASISAPVSIAVDANGNLYISGNAEDTVDPSYHNNAVRKVSNGSITTLAGSATAGYSGDGGLGANAFLNGPTGVAVDSSGNVYIADSGNFRVREVLAGIPTYSVSPGQLSFSGAAGGGVTPPQTINLSSMITGLGFSAAASASWLSVSPTSGSLPAQVQVTANPANLAPGSYQGSVTITAPNASPANFTVNVTFTVAASAPPSLAASAPAMSFSAAQGAAPLSQPLEVIDAGGGAAPFTVTVTSGGGAWLSVSPPSGTAAAGAPASLIVTASPGSLAPGTYNGTIVIAAAASSITIPATLSVSPAAGTLTVSQSGLTFNAVAQGGPPLPQQFGILNTGQGSLAWTAAASTLSGGNWLQVSPASGTVQQPFLSVSLITVTMNPAGLQPGDYYGSILIASSGAVNSPQSVTVVAHVLPPGTNLGPQLYPNGLIFTGIAGASPSSQNVIVGNLSTAPNSYQSSTIGPVAFLPTSATIQPAQPETLVVQPDFSSLGAGVTRGTITLQFSDGSPAQAINVLMSVAPAGSYTTSFAANGKRAAAPRSVPCPPAALNVVFRQPQASQSFNAVVGQPVTLEVAVSDSCGNSIVPGSQSPKILAFFGNGDAQQNMSYVGGGAWQTSWRPSSAASLTTVTIDALALSGTAVVGGQAALRGAIASQAAGGGNPLVGTVIHAASSIGGAPISPGELIAVKGLNLANGSSANLNTPLPTSSNGAQVFLGTQALPILYSSSGQMNVQVPFTVPVNTTYQLTVQNNATLSVPQSLVVAEVQPGIFTTNEQGFGQGAIFLSDDVTLAQSGTPATAGDVVVIYCTGLGAVDPPVQAGQSPPANPLSTTVNPVTVSFGGVPGQVLFSGLTPGAPGVYQLNVAVPSGVTTGDSVPVSISVAGQTSQPGVTMAIH